MGTEGWSMGNVFLDFIGGLLTVAQLLVDSWSTNDWSAITGDLPKLLLGNVSMLFDIVFMVQHPLCIISTCGGRLHCTRRRARSARCRSMCVGHKSHTNRSSDLHHHGDPQPSPRKMKRRKAPTAESSSLSACAPGAGGLCWYRQPERSCWREMPTKHCCGQWAYLQQQSVPRCSSALPDPC